MRADMSKVIVECYRGGRDRLNRTVRKDRHLGRSRDLDTLDDLPGRGPTLPRDGSRKWLGEHLQPLLRYLSRQVGRPWDEVYSEIRAHLAPASAVQMHVIQHLLQYVERHVRLDGQDAYSFRRSGWGMREGRPLCDDGRTFYVHPVSGLLCKPRTVWSRRAWRALRDDRHASGLAPYGLDRHVADARVERGGGRLYLKLDAEWYAVETVECVPGDSAWDPVARGPADGKTTKIRAVLYGTDRRRAVSKRQLSYRELKDAGLR